jgi:hypothetical protein
LNECGKSQGINIQPESKGGDVKIGDILLVRSGWVDTYHSKTEEERVKAARRSDDPKAENAQQWAGVKQEDKMLDWIHDCFFAAVAGDAPSFESWPSKAGKAPSLQLCFVVDDC